MFDATADSFERDVLQSDQPVVVDFWAPWCRPCRAAEAILEQLEADNRDRVLFAKVDIDEHPALAARYGVLSIPTAILFADGAAKASVVGVRARSHYESAWAAWLAASPAGG